MIRTHYIAFRVNLFKNFVVIVKMFMENSEEHQIAVKNIRPDHVELVN